MESYLFSVRGKTTFTYTWPFRYVKEERYTIFGSESLGMLDSSSSINLCIKIVALFSSIVYKPNDAMISENIRTLDFRL